MWQIIFLTREFSQNTEDEFIKESNIPADNVAKNFLNKELSQHTEDQFMEGSNILADNV